MITAIVTTILSHPFQIALGIIAIVYSVRAASIALRLSRSESKPQAIPRAAIASSFASGHDSAPSSAPAGTNVIARKVDEPPEPSCPAAGSPPGRADQAGETA